MRPINKLLSFFVYSNIFIAACALFLTLETFFLLKLPPSDNWYLFLIFLSTLFIYNLHYFVKGKKEKTDTRLEWCRDNHLLLLALISLSSLSIVLIVTYHFKSIFETTGQFNVKNLLWFITIPILSLAYSHKIIPGFKKSLRHFGWLKLAFLSFVWAFSTTLLPLYLFQTGNNGFANNIQLGVLFIHRFFLIAALSLLFNIYDFEEDKADGVKTIAVLSGIINSLRYGKWITLMANTITSMLLLYTFNLVQPIFFMAVLIPVIITFFLFQNFNDKTEEAIFVFRYDGLMIVQSLLLIFALVISN